MTVIPASHRDIAHIGHVELLTPKPDESLWYFRDLLGMEEAHREGGSVFLRGWGDYAASTLKLTEARIAGVGHVSWRAFSPEALERRATVIEATGLGIGWTNGDFGHGRSYQFNDPDGHVMEVYYEEDRYVAPDGLRSALHNQPMKYTGRGIGVRRSDHLALTCRDVAANREFMQVNLGCMLREQIRFENGKVEVGSWMSTTAVHHEVAYVRDNSDLSGRLHHFALWVDNREDVLRAADIFMENGIFIEAGPSKHNNSQAFYLYSHEPGGNRVEVYNAGFMVFAPDFEPVIWDEDNRSGGVYWGQKLPDSFRSYATPVADESMVDADAPVIDPI